MTWTKNPWLEKFHDFKKVHDFSRPGIQITNYHASLVFPGPERTLYRQQKLVDILQYQHCNKLYLDITLLVTQANNAMDCD